MGLPLEKDFSGENIAFFPYQKPPIQACWQRLLGVNILNLYRTLQEKGDDKMMQWLEDIHVDDYVVEVSSLPCPHRDRERIGKVVSMDRNSVTIQTENGQRIKWVNGKLLRVPETVF